MSMNLPILFHIAVVCSFLPKCSTSLFEYAAIKKKICSTFGGHLGGFQFGLLLLQSLLWPFTFISWCLCDGYIPSSIYRKISLHPPALPHLRCQLCHMSSVCVCLGPFPDPVFRSLVSAMPVQYFIIPKQTQPTGVVICHRNESVHHLTSLVVFLSIFLGSL